MAKWLALVRLLLGEIPEHSELTAVGLKDALRPYFELTQAVRSGDLTAFRFSSSLLGALSLLTAAVQEDSVHVQTSAVFHQRMVA